MDVFGADDPLLHMRQRVETCRRLAKSINDGQASQALRQMADQIEIDVRKLLAEREGRKERPGPNGDA